MGVLRNQIVAIRNDDQLTDEQKRSQVSNIILNEYSGKVGNFLPYTVDIDTERSVVFLNDGSFNAFITPGGLPQIECNVEKILNGVSLGVTLFRVNNPPLLAVATDENDGDYQKPDGRWYKEDMLEVIRQILEQWW